MYRQGLGDCFLIFLKRSNGEDYKIVIDCGVILGTSNPVEMMTNVVDNIVKETKGRIDLLLATHEHWDHLSGFIQAAESFKHLTVDQVWLAWTEDPQDVLAKQLREERGHALKALQMADNALQMVGDLSGSDAGGLGVQQDKKKPQLPPAPSRGEIVSSMLSFLGAASGHSTQDALDKVKDMAKGAIRYCRPADAPIHLGDPDARLYILGPPPDEKLIRRTLPSASSPETYGLALDGSGVLPLDVTKALKDPNDDPPFLPTFAIPLSVAHSVPFFQQHYWGPGQDAGDWRRIDTEWLDGAAELALALDSATNNTSLVVAIELAGGDVLLFVADAQVGNWESWQELSWNVDGHTVTGPDLLKRAVFYKVGHHGSHNATLKQNGLEMMNNLKTAVIPVNHEMAVKKHWGKMPLEQLETALQEKTGGRVLRIDQTPASAMAGVAVDELYFDVTL
jgi:beta-lactamase superfamily II metal-dependent hydrolase